MCRFFPVLVCLFGMCCAKNLVQLANDLGATTLVNYLRHAGLEGPLSRPGQYTLFAPSNAAFDALPADVVASLSKNTDLLKSVLMFHASDTRAFSSALSNNMMVDTLNVPLQIRVNLYNVNSATVVTVNGAKVTLADQNATNGVIHVIDKVMYPLPVDTIALGVANNPDLETLIYAVAQAQLTGPLEGQGPLTLFAPNNAAFEALPVGALSDLLSNQTALVAVLKYHVIPSVAYSAGLTSGLVTTLQGQSVDINVSAGGVTVNTYNVVQADIPMTNGVIHVIDKVLFPSV